MKRLPGGGRVALAMGKIPPLWDAAGDSFAKNLESLHGADEVHVHLLAETDRQAREVLQDLTDGLQESEDCRPAPVQSALNLTLAADEMICS